MLHSKIEMDASVHVRVQVAEGFPEEIDALAAHSMGGRSFLRRAWYQASASSNGLTFLALRADGSPLAAIPTAEIGPPLVGARSVPGSYWPFRSILVAEDAESDELAAMLADRKLSSAAPLWRMGPVLRDDPVTALLEKAAARAGWTMLIRPLGRTWLLDLTQPGWPRKTTRRRLANYERQLGQTGEVRFSFLRGSEWDEKVFEALATIERNSWVARKTDGSGAKFLSEAQRNVWRRAVRDPVIAQALSVTLLHVGDEPAAFSFDLQEGDLQYAIASSYDDRFAAARPARSLPTGSSNGHARKAYPASTSVPATAAIRAKWAPSPDRRSSTC
jgi:hypothetical protein